MLAHGAVGVRGPRDAARRCATVAQLALADEHHFALRVQAAGQFEHLAAAADPELLPLGFEAL